MLGDEFKVPVLIWINELFVAGVIFELGGIKSMTEFVIEAQKIPATTRHAFIIESFDNLEGGDSLVIINNHDPVPLLRFFQNSRTDLFEEEYLEKGPEVWRLKLTKKKTEGCCGFCGG